MREWSSNLFDSDQSALFRIDGNGITGNGKIPTLNDNVRVNYEGSFIDGTIFDSSYKRSESTVFGVKNVIKGWVEALTIMPVGSEWELYIPYQLGYGENGNSGIPAYSVLKFKIELLNIE